ncbi:SRPBCC family protein [Nonomuraea typhae]|uniref:SRPBCC family protein n=1 Tax=Nonomuraea typhae TaxID=2603600 RepID=UPI0012FA6543|nr:SRPBCC family protein [Nonomuraea typhae]
METVENSVVIGSTPSRVYELCADLGLWPTVFSAVESVAQNRVVENEVVAEMKVIDDLGESVTWCHWYYFPAHFYIGFEVLSLPPSTVVLNGSWHVRPDKGGARLEIVHNFLTEVDAEAASGDLAKVLHRSTERVLGELSTYLQRERDEAGNPGASRRPVPSAWPVSAGGDVALVL